MAAYVSLADLLDMDAFPRFYSSHAHRNRRAHHQTQAIADQQLQDVAWVPRMDVLETDDAFVLLFDLPGMTREDAQLDLLDDNILQVTVEAPSHPAYVAGAEFNYHERPQGRGVRRVQLPPVADAKCIEARVQDGVLEVKLAKREAAQKASIAIQ
jgi:HSP20 family protein